MNYSRIFIIIVEFLCVAILSLSGVVSFSNSGIYGGFENALARFIPSTYLSLLILLVLFALGVFFIIVKNKGGGGLAVAVIILCLPSIVSFNNIDLLKIFGGSAQFTTKMTFLQTISIGSLIITAYFLLDLINQLKLNLARLSEQQAPPSDLRQVIQHQHLVSIILAGAALLISLLVTAVARGFEYFISRNAFILSWWIVPVALFCIFVLGIYLYWVTTRKSI
jgi:hypothetical protein